MNSIQVHLLVNHLPIFSTLFAAVILLGGLLLKNKTVIYTGLGLAIFTALVIVPVNASGESAEEKAEKIPAIQHETIDDHEEASKPFLLLSLGLGFLSIISLVMERKKSGWSKSISHLILVGLCVNLYFAYLAGHSGGLIRHPEIKTEFYIPAEKIMQPSKEEDD